MNAPASLSVAVLSVAGLSALAAGLAAWGHGAWWMAALWAVGLWAARSSETARRSAVTMPFVLALLGALSAWPDLYAVTGLYLRLALVGLALHLALDALEERHVRYLLWLALVWCFAPSAPGLLGLGLGAAVFGHLSQRATRPVLSRRALGLLGGFIVAVAVFALFLPNPVAPGRTGTAPTSPPVVQENDMGLREGPLLRPQPGGARNRGPSDNTPPLIARSAEGLISLLLSLLAIILALVGYRMWRVRASDGGGWHWSDVLPVVALLSGAAMLMLYALLRTPPGAGGTPPPGSPGTPGGSEGTAAGTQGVAWLFTGLSWMGWFALIGTCLLLIVVIVAIVRSGNGDDQQEARQTARQAPAGGPEEALHRVRLAYRAMLLLLEAAGTGRGPHETPQEFAGRAGGLYPAVRGDIENLTRLYQPVRYGGVVTEEHADEAHETLVRLRAGLARTDLSAPSQEGSQAQELS